MAAPPMNRRLITPKPELEYGPASTSGSRKKAEPPEFPPALNPFAADEHDRNGLSTLKPTGGCRIATAPKPSDCSPRGWANSVTHYFILL
jgi:hypothetical protein